MAKIKNPVTSEMGHQVTGKVAILYGTVKAISPDGTVRILKINSPVFADDRIITGGDGSVSIVFDTSNHVQLDLGRMSNVVIDEDVYGITSPGVSAEAAAEKDAIQKALLASDQPLELDATAAGAEANAGGGHPIFVVTPDWASVTPDSGAETKGIAFGATGLTNYDPSYPTNSTPTITVNPGNVDGGNDVVNEAGIPGGSHAGDGSNLAYGTFTISDPDGLSDIQSVTINGTTIPIGSLVGSVIPGSVFTITSYDSTTGVAHYSYDLNAPTTDIPGVPELKHFILTVTDTSGETSAPATITIEITDDLPQAATYGPYIVTEDDANNNSINGNILSNVISGADAPAQFVGWADAAAAHAALDQYGTLSLNPDGTWSFVLNNSLDAVQALKSTDIITQTIKYTIQDADGDPADGSVIIKVNGADDPRIVDIKAGVGETGSSAEEGNPVTFTVSLDKASTVDTTVTVKVIGAAGDTATPGADYTTITTQDVIIHAGETSATFQVQTTDDAIQEPSETFTAEIVGATNANGSVTIGTGTAVGTILDNDTPTITIKAGSDIAGDSAMEGNPVTFTVSLDKASAVDTTVTVKVIGAAGDTATPNADYTTIATQDVTILAGKTSATFQVQTTDDAIQETSETFTAQIVSAANSITPVITIGGTGTAVGTILDNDTPTITIKAGSDIAGDSAMEGNPVTFTVSLDKASAVDTTVTVKVIGAAGDTATPNADYTTIATQDVIIHAGETSATFQVQTTDDAIQETSETFTAEIMSATNTITPTIAIGTGTAVGTITDNDVPTVSIKAGSDIVGGSAEEGNPVTFTVSLDKASAVDTTVTVKVIGAAGDTATPNADYTTIATQDVTILAGKTSATFQVQTTDDAIQETSETFTAEIMSATNTITPTIAIGTGTAVGTITDNDVPTVSIKAGSDIVGGSAEEGNPVTFTVSLDKASSVDTTVTVKVLGVNVGQPGGDTATPGADYTTIATQDVTILAGKTSATFQVQTTDDAIQETSETFTAEIMSATNTITPTIAIGTGTAVGTITDNDVPTVSIKAGSDIVGGSAEEGNPVTFTVSLDKASSVDTTVTVKVLGVNVGQPGGDTATPGADYTTIATQDVTILAGKTSATFQVQTTDDAIQETSETFTAEIMSATNTITPTIAIGTGTAVGTITDNDVPTVSIKAGSDIVGGSAEEGNPVTFTVSLDKASAVDTTVTVKVLGVNVGQPGGDTATPGADYTTIATQDVTILAGKTSATFQVQTTDDAIQETSETFTAEIMSATNTITPTIAIGTGTAVGTITDNDVPTVSIKAGSDIVGGSAEEGNPVTFTVSLDKASAVDTTVTVKVLGVNVGQPGGDTATPGADYTTIATQDVTILAGKTSATFQVQTTDDAIQETSETFTAEIMSATNTITPTIAIGTGTAVGTITDNDVPTVSIKAGSDIVGGSAEEGNPVTFTVSLDKASSVDTTVTVKVLGVNVGQPGGDTATPGADYTTIATQDVTILAGKTSATFQVQTTDDAIQETSETFTAEIMSATNTITPTIAIGTGTAVGTITDNDVPTVSIKAGSDIAGGSAEEGNPVTFTVSLDKASSVDTTVTVKVLGVNVGQPGGDTATPGADYTTIATQDVTILAGKTSATFQVQTLTDQLQEGNEIFTAQIVSATNSIANPIIGAGTAVGTILDLYAHVTVDASGTDVTVYEHGLTSTAINTETGSNTFSVTASDGISTVVVEGRSFTLDQLQAIHTSGTPSTGINTGQGTLVITDYVGTATAGTVGYTYTLKAPLSHPLAGNDTLPDSVLVTVNGSGGTSDTANLNIKIVDDIPTAFDQTVTVGAGHSVGTNLLLILDNSGSMDNASGVGTLTRLDLAKDALENMITAYEGHGNVMVKLVTFSTTAAIVGDSWMTANDAIAAINAVQPTNTTNYDDALAKAQTAFASSGAIAGGQYVSYFLSDGVPNQPQGSAGINATEQTAWENFLKLHDITSFSLGMGTGADVTQLAPIAYDGLHEVQMSPDGKVITDLSQLSDYLTNTVIVPDNVTGNLISGSVPVSFGADGPAALKIVSIAHDTNGDGTDEVYNTSSAGYDPVHTTLTLTTYEGGTLAVNFSTGEYTYTSSTTPALGANEVFKYTVVDHDGDTATANLTVNLPVHEMLVVGTNVNDQTGQTVDHYIDNDAPFHGTITGGGGNDILVGDLSATSIAGKTLNLSLILDTSGSMDDYTIQFNGQTMTRIAALEASVEKMLNDLGNGPAEHVRVQIVTFGSTANVKGVYDLKVPSELAAALVAVDNLQADGGTNYEAGLQKALAWANSTGDDAPLTGDNVISQAIFVSDGEPTQYYVGDGTTEVAGLGNQFDQTALNHILNVTGDNDTVSEVQALEAKGFTIEAVGINVTAANLDHLNQVEGASASVSPDVATNITTGDELSHVLVDLTNTSVNSAGNDNIVGGDGDDIIFGDTISYNYSGTESEMIAYIKANHLTLSAESGLTGGNDNINAGSGNDIVYGQEGNDILSGGAGNDLLSGGTGNNILNGGLGADTFVISKGGHDTIQDYNKGQLDKVDISSVLNEGAGDHLNVIANADGSAKLQILDSSNAEKASVSFDNIHYADLGDMGVGHELDSLIGKVTIEHS